MKEIFAHLGMLFGLLLCVAGLIALVATQFDPLYGGLGLVVAALGAGLTWRIRRTLPNEERSEAPQRSEQAPRSPASKRTPRGGGRL